MSLHDPVSELTKTNGALNGASMKDTLASGLDTAKTKSAELTAKGKDLAVTAGAKAKVAGEQAVVAVKKRPMAAALAVLGLGAAVFLVANPRTRGRALAAGAGAPKLAQTSGLALPGLAALGGIFGLAKAKPV